MKSLIVGVKVVVPKSDETDYTQLEVSPQSKSYVDIKDNFLVHLVNAFSTFKALVKYSFK